MSDEAGSLPQNSLCFSSEDFSLTLYEKKCPKVLQSLQIKRISVSLKRSVFVQNFLIILLYVLEHIFYLKKTVLQGDHVKKKKNGRNEK